jgi:hypothetical protein
VADEIGAGEGGAAAARLQEGWAVPGLGAEPVAAEQAAEAVGLAPGDCCATAAGTRVPGLDGTEAPEGVEGSEDLKGFSTMRGSLISATTASQLQPSCIGSAAATCPLSGVETPLTGTVVQPKAMGHRSASTGVRVPCPSA